MPKSSWAPSLSVAQGMEPYGLCPGRLPIPQAATCCFYSGGISEAENLLPYGSTSFASRAGQLAGNHFMTITTGRDRVAEFGNHVLWNDAMDIGFDHLD